MALVSKKSFCFSHWDMYLGMMTAMTQVPVLVLDLRLTIRLAAASHFFLPEIQLSKNVADYLFLLLTNQLWTKL